MLPGELAELRLVGNDHRVGQQRLQLLEAPFEFFNLVEHQ